MRFDTAEPIEVLPRGPAGPAGLVFQGPWAARSTYAARAVVLYDKQLWYAVRGSTNIAPGTNPLFWVLFLPQGASGKTGATPTLEWRTTSTHLQVRRVGDTEWIDAVALNDISPQARTIKAWTGGPALVDNLYAYDNKVWRAKTTTSTNPVAGANWELLYDGAAVTHNHDDRYYTKAQTYTKAEVNALVMAPADIVNTAILQALIFG